ncbi:hypothetical protein C7C56_011105 [Massilia glaciei]|uniref:Uncharacterized protein n=1 Tax=Massilia glaciei TaxID=1524097 RepID=A0A2U2HM77_9BURK|nr:hypothetical protein C7C56_011105 [Massilia glaciei]
MIERLSASQSIQPYVTAHRELIHKIGVTGNPSARLRCGSPPCNSDESIEIWAKQAGMDWQTREAPVRFMSGSVGGLAAIEHFPENKVLFRSDTNSPLSVVSMRAFCRIRIQRMSLLRARYCFSESIDVTSILPQGIYRTHRCGYRRAPCGAHVSCAMTLGPPSAPGPGDCNCSDRHTISP